MIEEKVKFGKSKVFFDTFTRRPGPTKKNMHYCPGCGHGILHKLVAEAVEANGIQEKALIIAPVGCAVFSYYYYDCGGISVPHGRAPAVGTGMARTRPENFVISYQGDGDLAAIGYNEFIQAANRGENMAVFFVNNSNYGMTGGQMAPTTLIGQKTTTSPYGRRVENDGYPMNVCEMINTLPAPIYIERVALTSTANILKARKAMIKAVKLLKERKGFSFVEIISPCPVNLKMDSAAINKFIDEEMTKVFPIKCYRDHSEEATPYFPPTPIKKPSEVKDLLFPKKLDIGVAPDFRNTSELFASEQRIKCAGFGGQGILSLGHMLATMAKLRNFNVTWLPAYGPEQRGGAASCSIIMSRDRIGSPMVDSGCNLLIAMTQTALDKFLKELKKGGILIYDNSTMTLPESAVKDYTVLGIDASAIALEMGNLRCANSVTLGALAAVLDKKYLDDADRIDFDKAFTEAVMDQFSSKPQVIELNKKAYLAGKKAAAETMDKN